MVGLYIRVIGPWGGCQGVATNGKELEFYCVISRLMPISYAMKNIWECHLSIECTPPTLESMSSTPWLLSANFVPPSNARAHRQLWCLWAPLHHLSAKLCPMSVHWFIQELELYCIISRLMPISDARDIFLECHRSLSVKCIRPPPQLFNLLSISSVC